MTHTYSPDVAPDLEPAVVHWQPTHRPQVGAAFAAQLALAVGAVAVGALAVGAVAVGVLAVGRMRVGRLEIGELDVGAIRRLKRAF